MNHWANPCIIPDSEFAATWSRDSDDPILVVMGVGFDVRACVVVERLVAVASRQVDVLLVELPVDSTDPTVRPLVDANVSRVHALIAAAGGQILHQPLPGFSDQGALGRLVSRAFQSGKHLDHYAEVIIDVSAMPRSVYFPLIRGILERAHVTRDHADFWPGDLHVAVCEHPVIDELVLEEGTKPMASIGGFSGPSRQRPTTVIWVPVLGERAGARIARLYDELAPDETCPVLPWPSRDPRRGDRLVLEHRDLLFQTIRLEPRNIIHASERNPFDLYRTLGELNTRYQRALMPLGTVAMVLSSHSSKLLSIGVLLAAYDFDLEVQHVSPGSYGIDGDPVELLAGAEVFDLWLTGTPYAMEGP
jgi:hypothetical protein